MPDHDPAHPSATDAPRPVVTAGPLTPPPDSEGLSADAPPAGCAEASQPVPRHTVADDLQGMLLAGIVSALGMSMFAQNGLMVGGVAGVAFLVHYVTGLSIGLVFVVANLPFYWLSLKRMGWEFTIKTFVAVGLVAVFTDLMPHLLQYRHISPLFSALIGGSLIGLGILFFIRHHGSLGGSGILAVYLQRSRGWSAGKVQMGFDLVLMVAACFVLQPMQLLYSALGAFVLSLVIAFNHRPGRYMGA